MKKTYIFALLLLLSGCASIPLGTMLEFRSFGKEDVIAINPEEIRAKIQVDEPVRADVSQAELTLALNLAKGTRTFTFPLVLLEESNIEPVERFFSRSAGKTEYMLELSNEAIQNFKTTQDILSNEQSGSLRFSIRTRFEELPEQVDEVRLSVFLKILEDSDFVTLFENAKIKMER